MNVEEKIRNSKELKKEIHKYANENNIDVREGVALEIVEGKENNFLIRVIFNEKEAYYLVEITDIFKIFNNNTSKFISDIMEKAKEEQKNKAH